MARFKQPADGQRQNPGTQSRRPAAHARHAAPSGSSQALREPAPRVETPTRGSRFADASRATAASHSFPALGNTSTRLVAGQVPTSVSTSSPDDAPRPINVDPAVTGSFSTIRDGQGAVVTTRETASAAAARPARPWAPPRPSRAGVRRRKAARPAPTRAPRGVIAGIIVAVIVVIGLATCAVRSIVDPAPSGDEAQAAGGPRRASAPTMAASPSRGRPTRRARGTRAGSS